MRSGGSGERNSGLLALAPEDALNLEMRLLDRVATGDAAFLCAIWSTQRCLAGPRSLLRNPHFEDACVTMAAKGWPVVLRETGGEITPLAPGILNITAVFIIEPGRRNSIHDAYGMFCAPILSSLETLGIPASCGSVPGSFCDGAYNIVAGGRKLAGTAQRWRRVKTSHAPAGSHAVLAHGSLLCHVDLDDITAAVNTFYGACRIDHRVRRDRHTTLSALWKVAPEKDRDADLRLIAERLAEAFQTRFGA